jgi:hypothetical protein
MRAEKEFNFKIEVEQFKFLPTNRTYLVSDKGRIFSKKRKRFLSGSVHRTGYLLVVICDDGKRKTRSVHNLVMEAFFGPPAEKNETNHKDGNKLNNCLANLEYCTKSENINHAFRLGLRKPIMGERNGNCKLTDSQVQQIREDIEAGGFSQRKLAKKYNVSQSLISCIKLGQLRGA